MKCTLCGENTGRHTTIHKKVVCLKCIDLILALFYYRL